MKIEYVYICNNLQKLKKKKSHKQHKQRHTQSREIHKINQSNSSISSFPCHLRPPTTSTTMTTTRRRQHDAADWTYQRRLAPPHHSFPLHHRPWNSMDETAIAERPMATKISMNAPQKKKKKKKFKKMYKMQFMTNKHDQRLICRLHEIENRVESVLSAYLEREQGQSGAHIWGPYTSAEKGPKEARFPHLRHAGPTATSGPYQHRQHRARHDYFRWAATAPGIGDRLNHDDHGYRSRSSVCAMR